MSGLSAGAQTEINRAWPRSPRGSHRVPCGRPFPTLGVNHRGGPVLTNLALLIVLAATSAGSPSRPSHPPGPAALSSTAADSIRRAVEKDRTETLEWLKTASTS